MKEQKYYLKYFDTRSKVLAICWAKDLKGYVPGDCYVRVVTEMNEEFQDYYPHTAQMTLAEARLFISENRAMLGEDVHRCHGLISERDIPVRGCCIDDGYDRVAIHFPEPIVFEEELAAKHNNSPLIQLLEANPVLRMKIKYFVGYVNKVTSNHRHGLEVPDRDLTRLANKQIEFEKELGLL